MTTFLVEHPHARCTDLQLRGERVEPLAFARNSSVWLERFVGDRFQLADPGDRMVVAAGQ